MPVLVRMFICSVYGTQRRRRKGAYREEPPLSEHTTQPPLSELEYWKGLRQRRITLVRLVQARPAFWQEGKRRVEAVVQHGH